MLVRDPYYPVKEREEGRVSERRYSQKWWEKNEGGTSEHMHDDDDADDARCETRSGRAKRNELKLKLDESAELLASASDEARGGNRSERASGRMKGQRESGSEGSERTGGGGEE